MKTYLTLLILIITSLQVRAEDASPDSKKPVCYSQNDLYRDLKYGRCDLFIPHSKNENISPVCSELQDVLKHDPVAILSDFYDKANEGSFFTAAFRCTGTLQFVKKNINYSSVDSSSLAARYAKKCNTEGLFYARLYGAEDKKDLRTKQKPSEILQKKMDELKIQMAVETDAAKSTALKKNLDECAKSLIAMTQPKIRLEDIRALKIPTDAKVVFLKQADKSGFGDESVQRTISSLPAPDVKPSADASANSSNNAQ